MPCISREGLQQPLQSRARTSHQHQRRHPGAGCWKSAGETGISLCEKPIPAAAGPSATLPRSFGRPFPVSARVLPPCGGTGGQLWPATHITDVLPFALTSPMALVLVLETVAISGHTNTAGPSASDPLRCLCAQKVQGGSAYWMLYRDGVVHLGLGLVSLARAAPPGFLGAAPTPALRFRPLLSSCSDNCHCHLLRPQILVTKTPLLPRPGLAMTIRTLPTSPGALLGSSSVRLPPGPWATQ